MELREAIELIEDNHPKNGPFIGQDFYSVPATQKAEAHAFSVILNAVTDGTLIPADEDDELINIVYLKGVADGKDQAAEKAILDLIDTPQHKGGDDE